MKEGHEAARHGASAALSDLDEVKQAIAWLRTPEAIRARCHAILLLGVEGHLEHFEVDLRVLSGAADYIAEVIRGNYPTLAIPYHARWRHFLVGGVDRWGKLEKTLDAVGTDEIARIRFDLCVVSVLLDAGSGSGWRYLEAESGLIVTRSEGLAVASLHAFRAGIFSGDKARPLRADAEGLASLQPSDIAAAFQVSPDNPLIGVMGRAALMRSLGETLRARPDLFGRDARIGDLYDHLIAKVTDGRLPASAILAAVLDGFGPVWPARVTLGGMSLGDVWRHSAMVTDDPTSGLVPFHKLSQWLTYSLIEIFEDAGIVVTELDALTGLPEYRNGGLFIDCGVIRLRDPTVAARILQVGDEVVVEWRALTLALLDAVAHPVRVALGRTKAEMPLARILEGGTWAAGRKIARALRPDGGPPLHIASDGTVF